MIQNRSFIIWLCAIAFILTGFSTSSARADDTPHRMHIGVSVPAADHGWTAGVIWWAKRAMALHPEIDWEFATANNPEKQVADIENMMAKNVDGLVILATNSGPITPIAKQAHERGIYIVNVDRGFLEPVADVFLEGDNKSFGRKAAEYIAQKLNGTGSIVILEGAPSTVNTDRVNSALEVFKHYPNIKVLGRQPTDWNREKALTVMQNFLSQFPHIDAVWAGDDDVALGAIQAIKQAGRDQEMWTVGGGGMKIIIKMIQDKDPLVPATITYPPSMIAAGIHIAASSLRDGNRKQISEFLPRHIVLDVDLITRENAAEHYIPDSAY